MSMEERMLQRSGLPHMFDLSRSQNKHLGPGLSKQKDRYN